MSKKVKLIICFLFLVISFMSKVNAAININAAGGEGAVSSGCKNGVCSSSVGLFNNIPDEPVDGLRVILMNGNTSLGKADLWFTVDKQSVAGGSKNIASIFNKYKVYRIVGGEKEVFNYANFLTKIKENNDTDTVQTLLTHISSTYTLANTQNYYLVIEPIFVLRYNYASYKYYFPGTIPEIFNGLLNLKGVPPKHEVWAKYFAYKDSPLCKQQSVTSGGSTYSTSGGSCGNWNVLKNYMTTFKLETTYGPFTNTGGTYVYEWVSNYDTNIYGKGILKISDLKTTGELVIEKKNNLGNKVNGAKFTVYSGSCNGTWVADGSTDANGIANFELSPGTYYVRETEKASNYYEDPVSTCRTVSIGVGDEKTEKYTNTLSCQYYLDEIVGADKVATTLTEKQNLIKLYKKEYNAKQGNYSNYNGLLNFTNPSCSNVSCDFVNNQYSCTSGWINYNDGTNNFSSSNISCYNDTITIGDNEYYCFTDFSFKSPLEEEIGKILKYRSSNPFTVYSGRFLLEYDSVSPIIYGYVHKHCFIPQYPKSTYKNFISNQSKTGVAGNYYDYVTEFNWQNKDMKEQNIENQENRTDAILIYDPPINNTTNNSWNIMGNINDSIGYDWTDDDYTYVFGKTVGYNFKTIYLKNGSGEYTYTACNGCRKTAGLLTKFTNKSQSTITLDFKINIDGEEYENEYNCVYNSEQQIITTEGNEHNLELEFRNISVSNPFPGKDGTTRKKGSNWSILTIDTNGDHKINNLDLEYIRTKMSENALTDYRYDINGDKLVNAADLGLLDKIIREYMNTGKDIYAETILSSSISSSGIDPLTNKKVKPKYKIKLTSKDIKAIREYNKLTTYDDYTLSCTNNGEKCYSRFLKSMENGILEYYDIKTGEVENTWVLTNKLIRN